MALLSIFVLVDGLRTGDVSTTLLGGLSFLLFGVGSMALIAQQRGWVPSSYASKRATRAVDRPRPVATSPSESKLDPGERELLGRSIEMLAAEGVFVPEVPTSDQLEAATADYGPPVTMHSVISAVFSSTYYDAAFEEKRYDANLRQHSANVEQERSVIEQQVLDLVELSKGELIVEQLEVEFGDDALVTVACVLNGEEFEVSYLGANKWMSTVVLQQLAARYERLNLKTRFAAIAADDEIYLACLDRAAVKTLNRALAPKGGQYATWMWIDEESFLSEAGAS